MEKNSDWGRALGDPLFDRWPRDGQGEPETPALLCNCKSLDLGDELKINMLEAYGIPCLKIYPGDGSFGKLILGMSGQGVDIYVPQSMLEDAQALCEAQPEAGFDQE